MKFILNMMKVALVAAIVILAFGVVVLSACAFIEWSWRPFIEFYLTNVNSVTPKGLRLFAFFYTAFCVVAAFWIRVADNVDKEKRIY